MECTVANRRHSIGDIDGFYPGTSVEGTAADGRQALGQLHSLQRAAGMEQLLSQGRNALGYDGDLQSGIPEDRLAHRLDLAGNGHRRQPGTAPEGIVSQTCQGAWQLQLCQAGASAEGVVSDAGHAGADLNFFDLGQIPVPGDLGHSRPVRHSTAAGNGQCAVRQCPGQVIATGPLRRLGIHCRQQTHQQRKGKDQFHYTFHIVAPFIRI